MEISGRILECQGSNSCFLKFGPWEIKFSWLFYSAILFLCIVSRFLAWAVLELWGLWTSKELFAKMVAKLKVTRLDQIEARSGPDLVSIFTRDFSRIKLDAVLRFGDVLNSGCEFLILCAFLSRDEPILFLAVIPVLLLFKYLGAVLREIVTSNGEKSSILSGASLEAQVDLIRGWLTNSVFGSWQFFLSRAQTRYRQLTKAEIFEFDLLAWGRFWVGFFVLVYASIIVSVIGTAFTSGAISLGVAGAMLGLVFRIRSVSDWFFWSLSSMQEAFVGFTRVDGLLMLPVENLSQLGLLKYEKISSRIDNSISFVRYSGSYNVTSPLVLRNVSFEIPAFSKVAILAPTGQGKSSLIQALLGQLQTHSGVIKIGEVSAIENDLRHLFSVATQFQFIIDGSLDDNLLLGRQISREKFREVKDLFGWHADEKNSSNLTKESFSAAEIALIGLGRTLLSDASILIFDEPFASLDVIQEKKLREVFRSFQEKTIIVISHRHGFIDDFDYRLEYLSDMWVIQNNKVI